MGSGRRLKTGGQALLAPDLAPGTKAKAKPVEAVDVPTQVQLGSADL